MNGKIQKSIYAKFRQKLRTENAAHTFSQGGGKIDNIFVLFFQLSMFTNEN